MMMGPQYMEKTVQIMEGEPAHGGSDDRCGAFSVEFSTDSQVIMFTARLQTRIFVDEGNGYECTNLDGLNELMNDWGGSDLACKMTFSEKKFRNIKFEMSKGAIFSGVYIQKDTNIKKVERENIKKAMFFGDNQVGSALMTESFGSGKGGHFSSYPFGICDALGLECILGHSNSPFDLYCQYNDGHTYLESLKYEKEHLNLNPDIIVFAGGAIIDWGYNENNLKKATDECYQYAKTNFPNAKIIVIGNAYTEVIDSASRKLNNILRERALDNGCYYIDLGSGETVSSSRRNNIKRKRFLYYRNWKF